jgi:hypothetical protein
VSFFPTAAELEQNAETVLRLIAQSFRCLSAERELAAIRACMLRFSDQQDEGQTTAELLLAVELEANCENERAIQAERDLATVKAERDKLRARVGELTSVARTGWESARLLAICPPTFGAPATEKAADEALAALEKP